MKLTNRLNLPQPLYDAVKNDPYDRGDADISVTSLIAPPRLVTLREQHKDEIEEDCSDRIYSLLGQLVHGLLERAGSDSGVVERRLFMDVEGWKVSGATDVYYPEQGLIQDYKLTTCYKFKGGGVPREHEEQLNCLAALHRHQGFPVNRLEIVGILRDWSKSDAKRDPNYPQFQVVVREAPLWSPEKALAFIRERVILHKQARVSLPRCSAEDRWQRASVYAVMKKGRKTALKLYPTRYEAEQHAKLDNEFYVEDRPGESIRCAGYCPVAQFCTQFSELPENKI